MSKLKTILIVLALIAAILAVLWPGIAGLGSRFGLWDFGYGLRTMTGEYWPIVRYVSMGLGALALIASALIQPRKVAGMVIGVAALALPFVIKMQADGFIAEARSVPGIHDITTDMQDPPMFTDELVAEREKTERVNPVNYIGKTTRPRPGDTAPGRLVADLQAEAYPDIVSLAVSDAPDVAYQDALSAVQSLGWKVFTDDAAAGIIEATDTTFWYGFKDDVIVRIRAIEGGSVIDVRSVSRVGGGDMGTNAKRIRKLRDKLS